VHYRITFPAHGRSQLLNEHVIFVMEIRLRIHLVLNRKHIMALGEEGLLFLAHTSAPVEVPLLLAGVGRHDQGLVADASQRNVVIH